jgi:cell division protein FtsQ
VVKSTGPSAALRGSPRRPSGTGTGSGAGKGSPGPARRASGPSRPGAAGRRGGRGPARRPRVKVVLFAVAGLAIMAGMAWALLGPRLLVVRSARVIGAGRMIPATQVLAVAHVPYGLPLIRVNTGAIARQVEQLRQVQYAEVSKDWPSTVVITVQPRTPVFAVRAADGYALVDRFGVSIRDVAVQPPGLPLLSVGDAAVALRGNAAVAAAARVLGELPRQVARKVRSVSAANSADVSVTLADGAVVIWGNTENATAKAKELTLLMRRNARTYDVSSPGVVMVSR